MPEAFAYPLSEFYAHAKLPLPRIERIAADALPAPFRALLEHSSDMTPTLEQRHGARIHLETLRTERRGAFYFREVVLRLENEDDTPVEFGANKIHMALFPDDAQAMILEGNLPLGRILKDCEVAHRTEAKAFLRVESDDVINRAFNLPQPVTLYGRKALICDLSGRPLSEIVEVLPPSATP